MNRNYLIVSGGVAALLLGAWWLGAFGERVDPAVLELEEAAQQFVSAGGPPPQEFREQVRSLTDDQRRQFFERQRPQFEQRGRDMMNGFFELSKEDQRRELDKRVDEIIARRKERQQPGESAGPQRGRERLANMSEGERDTRRKQMLDRTDPTLRAQFTEYRRLLNERLEARGQEPIEGRGPGFGPPRGARRQGV